MCRYHFTFAVLYIFTHRSFRVCLNGTHGCQLRYLLMLDIVIVFLFFSKVGWDIAAAGKEREPTTFTQHLSTFGNKWRCFE